MEMNKELKEIKSSEKINQEQGCFGLHGFRDKVSCHVKDIVGDAVEKRLHKDGTFNIIIDYTVYTASIGKGNTPIFILVNKEDKIKLGDVELWLKKLSFEEATKLFFARMNPSRKVILEMCKQLNIPTKDPETKESPSNAQLIQQIFEDSEKNPCIFTITTGLPAQELGKLTDEKANELIETWVEGGYEKDKIIVACFKAAVPLPNISLVKKPGDLMPHQPHFICFTNTKVAKTFTAKRVGENLTRASPANLLGFSTGNDINRGSLDGENKLVALDEMQEERQIDLLGKLLNIMEDGEAKISVGKQSINTRFYGYLGFLGNPKSGEGSGEINMSDTTREKSLLALKMVEMLKKTTLNYQAYGSRIGLVIFNTNLSRSTVKEVPLSSEEMNALDCIAETLRQEIRDTFTRLFYVPKVIGWLNKGFDKEYITQVRKTIDSISLSPIREFLKGHLEAYKHLRGMGLRLAVVEKISSIRKQEMLLDNILDLAERRFQYLCTLNLASFKNISDAIDETTITNYHQFLLENLPTYQEIVVKAIVKWAKNNPQHVGSGTTLNTPQLYEYVLEELKAEGSTMSVARVWILVFNDGATHTNSKLVEFGLRFEELDKVQTVIITDWTPVKNLLALGAGADKGQQTSSDGNIEK